MQARKLVSVRVIGAGANPEQQSNVVPFRRRM